MKRQLDLRSGRLLVALGTLGLGGAYATTAAMPARAGAQANDKRGRPSTEPVDSVRAVVLTDSVGVAAGALSPDRPLGVVPVVSATETRRDLLVGESISVRGAVQPVTVDDRSVALDERRGDRWLTVARARTQAHGWYRLGFRPSAPGTVRLRVRVAGAGGPQTQPRRTLAAVNIYRRAFASWYGGGGALACGGTLTDSTLGVASKTLPCGTIVRLRVGQRTVRVPVVDRGPYVAGREFDLTAATKRALGFGDLGTIWVSA